MEDHHGVRVIVLIKQVPDLRSAAVGMSSDGTIERAQAPAITNPADLHALEAALRLGDEVWAVSMGPPRAEEVLRDAIARGADRGCCCATGPSPGRTPGRRPTRWPPP